MEKDKILITKRNPRQSPQEGLSDRRSCDEGERGEGEGRGERRQAGHWHGEWAGRRGEAGGDGEQGMGEGVGRATGEGCRAGQPPVPAGPSIRSGLMFKIVIQGNVPRVERAELVPGRAPRAQESSPTRPGRDTGRQVQETPKVQTQVSRDKDPRGKPRGHGTLVTTNTQAGQHGHNFSEHVGETRREPSTHTPGERPSRVGGRNTGFNGQQSREFDQSARAKVFGGELRPRFRLCRPRCVHSNGSSVPVWTYTQVRVHAYTGPHRRAHTCALPHVHRDTA